MSDPFSLQPRNARGPILSSERGEKSLAPGISMSGPTREVAVAHLPESITSMPYPVAQPDTIDGRALLQSHLFPSILRFRATTSPASDLLSPSDAHRVAQEKSMESLSLNPFHRASRNGTTRIPAGL